MSLPVHLFSDLEKIKVVSRNGVYSEKISATTESGNYEIWLISVQWNLKRLVCPFSPQPQLIEAHQAKFNEPESRPYWTMNCQISHVCQLLLVVVAPLTTIANPLNAPTLHNGFHNCDGSFVLTQLLHKSLVNVWNVHTIVDITSDKYFSTAAFCWCCTHF